MPPQPVIGMAAMLDMLADEGRWAEKPRSVHYTLKDKEIFQERAGKRWFRSKYVGLKHKEHGPILLRFGSPYGAKPSTKYEGGRATRVQGLVFPTGRSITHQGRTIQLKPYQRWTKSKAKSWLRSHRRQMFWKMDDDMKKAIRRRYPKKQADRLIRRNPFGVSWTKIALGAGIAGVGWWAWNRFLRKQPLYVMTVFHDGVNAFIFDKAQNKRVVYEMKQFEGDLNYLGKKYDKIVVRVFFSRQIASTVADTTFGLLMEFVKTFPYPIEIQKHFGAGIAAAVMTVFHDGVNAFIFDKAQNKMVAYEMKQFENDLNSLGKKYDKIVVRVFFSRQIASTVADTTFGLLMEFVKNFPYPIEIQKHFD